MLRKTLLATVICAVVAGCTASYSAKQSPQTGSSSASAMSKTNWSETVNSAVDDNTKRFMALQPGLATALNLTADIAGDHYRRLPDYSVNGMKQVQTLMTAAAETLEQIPLAQLDDNLRRHVEVNLVIDRYFAGSLAFPGGFVDTWGGHLPYIVNQINGPLIDIPTMLQDQHMVTNRQQATDYLTRLGQLATMTDQVLAKLQSDEKRGIILPKKLFPNTLGYLTGFVALAPEKHTLVSSFAAKMATATGIDGKLQQQLLDQASEMVEQQIFPAYQRVADYMAKQQHRAPQGDGIWAQPGGAEFYRHEVQYLADSFLDPNVIHQIGLDEVARITTEMDQILKQNGKTQGTVGERMMALNADPQFLYEDSDAGREKLLGFLREQISKINEQAPSLFATLPRSSVTVRRIPVVREQGAPGGFYQPPAIDGSRPGEFFINLYDMKANPSFGLKTLAYHEAVPGHHFQAALNMEQQGLGIMRQNGQFNAYVEGWALYSEQLAKEIGMYQDDPWGDLGRLQAELYRAARLVVDTGLHAKKWDREKTVEYFYQVTGVARSDAQSAINRYMVWPGQALGYKLGMLKIVELRNWAQQQLGDQFSIKEYHDLVLLPGARPLPILEADVKRWVAAKL